MTREKNTSEDAGQGDPDRAYPKPEMNKTPNHTPSNREEPAAGQRGPKTDNAQGRKVNSTQTAKPKGANNPKQPAKQQTGTTTEERLAEHFTKGRREYNIQGQQNYG